MNETPPQRIKCGMGVLVLEGTYPVYYHEQIVGTANLTKEGMHWCIYCHCQYPLNGRLAIKIQKESECVDLGLCVPYENGFGLQKRVSVKILGQGSLRFLLEKQEKRKFIPISVPFAHIAKIPKGNLRTENGKYGVYINEV